MFNMDKDEIVHAKKVKLEHTIEKNRLKEFEEKIKCFEN